jgi:MFS transporter, SP family, sugar:H+ symporter
LLNITKLAMSWILADHLGKHQTVTMTHSYALAVLVLMSLYAFSFDLSWGPLKWVIPSEIYPVEIRSAGQATTVSVALCLAFAQTQVFVTLLCAMRYGIFLFYAGWVVVMTVFIAVFLPETKGVPLDAMRSVWAMHWYWSRFAGDAKQ